VFKYKFFIIVFIFGLCSLVPALSRFLELREKNENVGKNIQEMAQANKLLYEKQRKMQTDAVYAEAVARQQLNVAKEGEVIYKILPKKQE